MKLMPASSAAWIVAIDVSWSGSPQLPNIIAPRHNGLTWIPVRPRLRYSMNPTLPTAAYLESRCEVGVGSVTVPDMSDATTGPTRAETSTKRAVLNTVRGSAGNLVEWYDVYVYTVFASYFEAQFFDKNDTNSTVYIYAIFAVTFVMRPVGSWFFGRFADRRGRRAALTISVSVMAACSMVVALVPGRATIG